jgi:hypothetical protein
MMSGTAACRLRLSSRDDRGVSRSVRNCDGSNGLDYRSPVGPSCRRVNKSNRLIASKNKEPLKAKPPFIHQASSVGEAKKTAF